MGLRRLLSAQELKGKYIRKLKNGNGMEAFVLIVSLRLLPFIPSGLVNVGAAFGKVSLFTFSLATILGKIPALFIEALTVNSYISWESDEIKTILTIASVIIILSYILIKKNEYPVHSE